MEIYYTFKGQSLKNALSCVFQAIGNILFVCVCVSFFFNYYFLGPHPLHMEVPRLGVELEL